jgi:hypothetical protein
MGGYNLEVLAHALMDTERERTAGPEDQDRAVELIRQNVSMPRPSSSHRADADIGPAPAHWGVILLSAAVLIAVGIYLVGRGATQAQVVLAFVSFSLVGALMTFGILRSTGLVKTKGYQFGGAAAGFVVVLGILLPFARDTSTAVSGVLYLDGVPPTKATVYLLETEARDNMRTLDERDQGKFEFKNVPGLTESKLNFNVVIPGYQPIVVTAPYQSGSLVRLNVETKQLRKIATESAP